MTLTERGRPQLAVRSGRRRTRLYEGLYGQATAAAIDERRNHARVEIAEQITALERRRLGASIHETAGNRLALLSAVRGDRIDQPGSLARRCGKAAGAFADVPAVVAAALDDVDLLVAALADVGDPELSRRTIETPAPRIAQPERVNLRT